MAEGKSTPRNGVRVWDFLNFLCLNFLFFSIHWGILGISLDFSRFLGFFEFWIFGTVLGFLWFSCNSWDFPYFLRFSKEEITAQSGERDKDFGDFFEIIWIFGISGISLEFMGVMGSLFDLFDLSDFLVFSSDFWDLIRTLVIFGISFRIPWIFGIFLDVRFLWDFWNFWDFLIF